MSGQQFLDLQEALVAVFLPIIEWCMAFVVAFGFISAIGWIFLTLYAFLTRR